MTDPLRAAHRPTVIPMPPAADTDARIAAIVARYYGIAFFADRPLTIPEDFRLVWADGFAQGWAAAVKRERETA